MKSLKIVIGSLIIIVVSSCFFDKKPKDVDPFYFTRNYGQFPLLPLIKPVKLSQDDQSLEWSLEIPHSFKQRISTDKLADIGIDKTFIYGKIKSQKYILNNIKKGDLVYARKFGGTLISQEPMEAERVMEVYPIDSTSNTYIIPERWFIINIADSTTEAFFSKKKYEEYLKEKGISGKMYSINKYYKQYKETGILPWFPDSVKVKLKK